MEIYFYLGIPEHHPESPNTLAGFALPGDFNTRPITPSTYRREAPRSPVRDAATGGEPDPRTTDL